MNIELQWAFTEEDMREGPCAICEAEFEPRAVIIRTGPYGLEACEGCLRALSGRKAEYPGAPRPTWEEYRTLVEAPPEPMFASLEEAEASEKAGDLGGGSGRRTRRAGFGGCRIRRPGSRSSIGDSPGRGYRAPAFALFAVLPLGPYIERAAS